MFGRRKKEYAELSEKYDKLEAVVEKLAAKVDELGKRTISQRTQEEDAPVPFNQILDEWLNGDEKGGGDKKEGDDAGN